jgi:hypothetical protein
MSQRAATQNHQISGADEDGFCLRGYELVGGILWAQLGLNTSYEHFMSNLGAQHSLCFVGQAVQFALPFHAPTWPET